MTSKREPASRAKAHQSYYLADGTKVPSVTSILGVIGGKEYLLVWANRLGLDGYDVIEYRKAQAAVGTLGHGMIEADLRGESMNFYGFSQEEIDRAENVLSAFRAWRRTVDLEPILIEEPLVSEVAKYGGTIDLYVRLGDKRGILDIKTSGDIYDEHWFQVGGYRRLCIENGYPIDFNAIIRAGRSEGGRDVQFAMAAVPDEDLAVFDAAHGLYLALKARGAAAKNEIPVTRKRQGTGSIELVLGGRGAAGKEAPVVPLPTITEEGRT